MERRHILNTNNKQWPILKLPCHKHMWPERGADSPRTIGQDLFQTAIKKYSSTTNQVVERECNNIIVEAIEVGLFRRLRQQGAINRVVF